MLHLFFGLVWLSAAVSLLFIKKDLEAKGHNVGMLLAFTGMLAAYNFLRFGISWFSRRRCETDEPESMVPACPRCGRPMRLVDFGSEKAEKDRWKFVCCGYQLQIDDDEERRRLVSGEW